MSRSLPSRALHSVFGRINQKRQWHELPFPANLLNLLSLRLDMRDKNLYDAPDEQIQEEGREKPPPEALLARRADGQWNDLNDPDMGATGTKFGRNIDPGRSRPEKEPKLFDPNPRTVSLELMTRR